MLSLSRSLSHQADAADRGYLVTVVTDACLTYSQGRHDAALRSLAGYGRQEVTETVAAELGGGGGGGGDGGGGGAAEVVVELRGGEGEARGAAAEVKREGGGGGGARVKRERE